MTLLVDTHALIWFLEDDPKLSQQARRAIAAVDNQSYVSDATAWEVGIKSALGKLKLPAPYEEVFPARLHELGFGILPIRHAHFHELMRLPLHHRDPFDRLLIAQARVEGLTVVSADPAFAAYGVSVIG